MEDLDRDVLIATLPALLKRLTYREREILKLRYGLDGGYCYTLEEIGKRFKVTRARVRAIAMKALRRLKPHLTEFLA